MGGQNKLRPLWRHYYAGTQALIFVLDSRDLDRFEEAKTELYKIIQDREMKDCVLLVLTNKSDLQGGNRDRVDPRADSVAMTSEQITERLELAQMTGIRWKVQRSCAVSGEGLQEGFLWLVDQLKHQ